jgi:hypothetical protein
MREQAARGYAWALANASATNDARRVGEVLANL